MVGKDLRFLWGRERLRNGREWPGLVRGERGPAGATPLPAGNGGSPSFPRENTSCAQGGTPS